jgi:hypothetical protein
MIKIRGEVIYPRSRFYSAMKFWWTGVLVLAGVMASTGVVAALAYGEVLESDAVSSLMGLIGVATTALGLLLVFALGWPYSLVGSMLHGEGSDLRGELRFVVTSPSAILTGLIWVSVLVMATLGTSWTDSTAMWLTSTASRHNPPPTDDDHHHDGQARGRPTARSPLFAEARTGDIDKFLGLGTPLRPTRDFPAPGLIITKKQAQGYAKLASQTCRTRRLTAQIVSTLSTAFVASAAIWAFSGEPDPRRTLVVMLPVLGFAGGIGLESRARTYGELAEAYTALARKAPPRSRLWWARRRKPTTDTVAAP